MSPQEISDWVDFCEGRRTFERDHFSTMFMEFYLEPLQARDIDALRTVFKYVPESRRILDKMMRMNSRAEDKTRNEILDLVRRDLFEKRKVITSDDVLSVIDSGVCIITDDVLRFDDVASGRLNREFVHSVADCVTRRLSSANDVVRALNNAFYGIASSVQLQWALTADLLDVGVGFDNYFELYLIGVDYAVGKGEVVVMDYRAAASRRARLEAEGEPS